MKPILSLIFILGAIMVRQAFAAEVKTNEWGVVACNAQMSIELKNPTKEIKTNQPVDLVIYIKGISTNETSYFVICSYPTDFSWIVTSPSGKKLFFKESQPMDSFATMMVPLHPNQTRKSEFKLSSVCNFNEIGTYKVIGKKEILSSGGLKKCEVMSYPLKIIVSN